MSQLIRKKKRRTNETQKACFMGPNGIVAGV